MRKALLIVGFVGFLVTDGIPHRAGVGTLSPASQAPKENAGGLPAPCLEILARSVIEVAR